MKLIEKLLFTLACVGALVLVAGVGFVNRPLCGVAVVLIAAGLVGVALVGVWQ